MERRVVFAWIGYCLKTEDLWMQRIPEEALAVVIRLAKRARATRGIPAYLFAGSALRGNRTKSLTNRYLKQIRSPFRNEIRSAVLILIKVQAD
jgi:hypothetical protein